MKERIVTNQNVHRFSVQELEQFIKEVRPSLPKLERVVKRLTTQAREATQKFDRLNNGIRLARHRIRVERKKSQVNIGSWYGDVQRCGKGVKRLIKFLSVTKRGQMRAIEVDVNQSGMFFVYTIEYGNIDDFTPHALSKHDVRLQRVVQFVEQLGEQGLGRGAKDGRFFKIDKKGHISEAFGDFLVDEDGTIRREYPGVRYERCDMDPIMPDGIFR